MSLFGGLGQRTDICERLPRLAGQLYLPSRVRFTSPAGLCIHGSDHEFSVTTLSWFAASNGKASRELAEDQIEVEVEHRSVNLTHATSPANGLRKHRAHARLSHNH
jgi:hypothetical protein